MLFVIPEAWIGVAWSSRCRTQVINVKRMEWERGKVGHVFLPYSTFATHHLNDITKATRKKRPCSSDIQFTAYSLDT